MGHEVGIPVYPTGPRYHVHCLNVVLHICCSHSTIKPGCGSTYMRHYTFSTSLDAAQHGTAERQHNILSALQTYGIKRFLTPLQLAPRQGPRKSKPENEPQLNAEPDEHHFLSLNVAYQWKLDSSYQ